MIKENTSTDEGSARPTRKFEHSQRPFERCHDDHEVRTSGVKSNKFVFRTSRSAKSWPDLYMLTAAGLPVL